MSVTLRKRCPFEFIRVLLAFEWFVERPVSKLTLDIFWCGTTTNGVCVCVYFERLSRKEIYHNCKRKKPKSKHSKLRFDMMQVKPRCRDDDETCVASFPCMPYLDTLHILDYETQTHRQIDRQNAKTQTRAGLTAWARVIMHYRQAISYIVQNVKFC